MPTLVGPFAFSAALNFSAITVKALVPGDGRELAVLSYWPFVLRSIGCVRRSWPYMILERK